MTFKNFCYEMWMEYIEECIAYSMTASPYKDWIKNNKWYLRKVYRVRYNKLRKPWKSDINERILSGQ